MDQSDLKERGVLRGMTPASTADEVDSPNLLGRVLQRTVSMLRSFNSRREKKEPKEKVLSKSSVLPIDKVMLNNFTYLRRTPLLDLSDGEFLVEASQILEDIKQYSESLEFLRARKRDIMLLYSQRMAKAGEYPPVHDVGVDLARSVLLREFDQFGRPIPGSHEANVSRLMNGLAAAPKAAMKVATS